MASSSRKRAFNDETGDSSPQMKRARTTNSSPKSSALSKNESKTDTNGDPYWEISRMRRVTISTFKGQTLVNVREYFKDKKGQELPGKKGISLPLDQFNALLELLPDIEEAVRQKGGTLVRPEYKPIASAQHGSDEGPAEEDAEDANNGDDDGEKWDALTKKSSHGEKEGQFGRKRSNIEATSDEDESE